MRQPASPRMPLTPPQQEFSWSLLSPTNVQTAPGTPHEAGCLPPDAPYPHHSKNSLGVCFPQPTSRQTQTRLMRQPASPRMPRTPTTARIFLEFVVPSQRPDRSRHSSCGSLSPPECPLPPPQQEFSWSLLSQTNVQTDPDTPHEAACLPQNAPLPPPQQEFSWSLLSQTNVQTDPDTPHEAACLPQNAPYTHHSKNSLGVRCPGQRPDRSRHSS